MLYHEGRWHKMDLTPILSMAPRRRVARWLFVVAWWIEYVDWWHYAFETRRLWYRLRNK